jgi:hypothetical protein
MYVVAEGTLEVFVNGEKVRERWRFLDVCMHT